PAFPPPPPLPKHPPPFLTTPPFPHPRPPSHTPAPSHTPRPFPTPAPFPTPPPLSQPPRPFPTHPRPFPHPPPPPLPTHPRPLPTHPRPFPHTPAPPKPVPKTIENQREHDETTVDPTDEEVKYDEETDEFAPYFNKQTTPKILITTSDRPRGRTVKFTEQLSSIIPNSHVYYRRGLALKKIIPQCIARDFTDLIVLNEDRKVANGLILSHLPDGPTAHFKMSNVRLRKEMKRKGKDPTEHQPEVILNNFTTRLGHSIGRMFASLFPHEPQFTGRQVATFHNQRDYIFFRFHRYLFKSEKRVGIQELGPRFTLKLRSLQKGTFDSKYGEYEWVHKVPCRFCNTPGLRLLSLLRDCRMVNHSCKGARRISSVRVLGAVRRKCILGVLLLTP
uniref:Ribosome production factor 1 n=1 Tax=Leptobrachium leishanense TaxID=445787 RepID=A0A8C5WFF3_9ANUR